MTNKDIGKILVIIPVSIFGGFLLHKIGISEEIGIYIFIAIMCLMFSFGMYLIFRK
jgi:hypothetical protein